MTRFIQTLCWNAPSGSHVLAPTLLNTAAVTMVTLPDDGKPGMMVLVATGDKAKWLRLRMTWEDAVATFVGAGITYRSDKAAAVAQAATVTPAPVVPFRCCAAYGRCKVLPLECR